MNCCVDFPLIAATIIDDNVVLDALHTPKLTLNMRERTSRKRVQFTMPHCFVALTNRYENLIYYA